MQTREPQYAACFDAPCVELGAMAGATWLWNPRRLGMALARYKFVAKMLEGADNVAEIGCADGFCSRVVAYQVHRLTLFDFDPAFVREAKRHAAPNTSVGCSDITVCALPGEDQYDAIYMLDVLEHIAPEREPNAMANICDSLTKNGIFIAGVPSLEGQAYATDIARTGHVNCKTGETLRADARRYFRNVFLFGMNDEVLHTGFAPMCHYLFILCTGPIR